MANNGKYLGITAGRHQEENAIGSSAGAGDASKIIKTDSGGKLDPSFLPAGIAQDVRIITASENLGAGAFVNIHNSGGLRVRNADATAAGKEAMGYVLAAVLSGAAAVVYSMDYVNNQLSGRTIGAAQYLATTPGAVTETPPSGSGNVVQFLGYAYSATEVVVEGWDRGTILA